MGGRCWEYIRNLAIYFKSRRTHTEGGEKKDAIKLIKSIRYLACLPNV